ncbi:MAG: tetratricopeptide repeat protein, partial [Vicinamibacterales bacterium]
MRIGVICSITLVAASLSAATAAAQHPTPQQLFESGQLNAAAQAIAEHRGQGRESAGESYLEGLIFTKLNQPDQAREAFSRLATLGGEPWAPVQASALALLAGDNAGARDAAQQAAATAPDLSQAHYQLGTVLARFEDWAGSADAFRQAAARDPAFAYAHYYAGLAYSRAGRADRTSEHF